MSKRKSIHIKEFKHANPIPACSRIGNIVMSGVINGIDPATGKVAPTLEEQCAHMFQHMKRMVEAAGGTTDDIIKMTVWMGDRSQREALNREWLKMFPDEHSRPARHALRTALDGEGGIQIQCDFMAVLQD
jgi:2-iminobutanoate/2-iminopropanoate deaminase